MSTVNVKHEDRGVRATSFYLFIFYHGYCRSPGIITFFVFLPLYSTNIQQHHWSQSLLKLLQVLKSPAVLCILLALFLVLFILPFSVLQENQCHHSNSLKHSFHLALCYVNGPPPTWGLQRHTGYPKPSHIWKILKQSTRDVETGDNHRFGKIGEKKSLVGVKDFTH